MTMNHLVLLDKVIEQEKKNFAPDDSDSDFFEYFVIKEILKDEDLSSEDIESGRTDGSRDGGVDAIFLFLNDRLMLLDMLDDEDYELNTPKYPPFRVHLIQASTSPGFKETAISKLKELCSDFFNLSIEPSNLEKNYNAEVTTRINLFQSLYKKSAIKFPKLEIRIHYATKSTDKPNDYVQKSADRLREEVLKLFGECDIYQLHFKTRTWANALFENHQ